MSFQIKDLSKPRIQKLGVKISSKDDVKRNYEQYTIQDVVITSVKIENLDFFRMELSNNPIFVYQVFNQNNENHNNERIMFNMPLENWIHFGLLVCKSVKIVTPTTIIDINGTVFSSILSHYTVENGKNVFYFHKSTILCMNKKESIKEGNFLNARFAIDHWWDSVFHAISTVVNTVGPVVDRITSTIDKPAVAVINAAANAISHTDAYVTVANATNHLIDKSGVGPSISNFLKSPIGQGFEVAAGVLAPIAGAALGEEFGIPYIASVASTEAINSLIGKQNATQAANITGTITAGTFLGETVASGIEAIMEEEEL